MAGSAAGLRQLDIIVRRNFEDALDDDTGRIRRIEAGLDFVTVADPVIIGIGIVRIGAGNLLVFVRQAVTVRVFDIVIDTVTIRVSGERAGVGTILVEVGQAVAVAVEFGETKAGLHRFLRLLEHQAGNLDIGVGISARITEEQFGDSAGTDIAGRLRFVVDKHFDITIEVTDEAVFMEGGGFEIDSRRAAGNDVDGIIVKLERHARLAKTNFETARGRIDRDRLGGFSFIVVGLFLGGEFDAHNTHAYGQYKGKIGIQFFSQRITECRVIARESAANSIHDQQAAVGIERLDLVGADKGEALLRRELVGIKFNTAGRRD